MAAFQIFGNPKPLSGSRWAAAFLFGGALLSVLSSAPAMACGPSRSLTSAEILEFQTGLIERGLKREKLTDAQRVEIEKLRADVESMQGTGRRVEAQEVMKKIVGMFSYKEMMGAVEPIVPGCAPMHAPVITGTLQAIESESNVAGARCGYHYILAVKENGPDGRIIKLTVYDLGKAPYDRLKAMLNKPIEAETLGGSVVSIRPANSKPDDVASLSGLSPRKPC